MAQVIEMCVYCGENEVWHPGDAFCKQCQMAIDEQQYIDCGGK